MRTEVDILSLLVVTTIHCLRKFYPIPHPGPKTQTTAAFGQYTAFTCVEIIGEPLRETGLFVYRLRYVQSAEYSSVYSTITAAGDLSPQTKCDLSI